MNIKYSTMYSNCSVECDYRLIENCVDNNLNFGCNSIKFYAKIPDGILIRLANKLIWVLLVYQYKIIVNNLLVNIHYGLSSCRNLFTCRPFGLNYTLKGG